MDEIPHTFTIADIRLLVEQVVATYPVQPTMNRTELHEIHLARERAVRTQCDVTAPLAHAMELLRLVAIEDIEEVRKAEIRKEDPEKLWYPVNRQDDLSGFLPLEMLGRGQTSEVYKCKTRFSDVTVVLKLLKSDEQTLRTNRALREVQILFKRVHPNIVRVYDAGHILTPEDGETPYIAMENLEGTTLRKWIEEQDRSVMPIRAIERQAAEIVAALAEAIDHCHYSGIAHGDIHPNNAYRCENGVVKLIDFGCAGGREHVPSANAPVGYRDAFHEPGTEGWQMSGDRYALGAVLVFCATGQEPPVKSRRAGTSAWTTALNDLPIHDPALKAIISKAMAYHPFDQYARARDLAEDLRRWLNNFPVLFAPVNYTRLEKEKLLVRRCFNTDDETDHSHLIGRSALLLALLIGLAAVANGWLVEAGYPANEAFIKVGGVLNVSVLVLILTFLSLARWRSVAMRMYEPMLATLAACVIVFFIYAPSVLLGVPTSEQIVEVSKFFLIVLCLSNILVGSTLPRWRSTKILGWVGLALTIGLKFVPMSMWWSNHMYLPIAAMELLGCVVFAMSHLGRDRRMLVQPQSPLEAR